jgi:hypothetical protein
MVWVFEDFDNAIKKMTAALGHVDALLDEMEPRTSIAPRDATWRYRNGPVQ